MIPIIITLTTICVLLLIDYLYIRGELRRVRIKLEEQKCENESMKLTICAYERLYKNGVVDET